MRNKKNVFKPLVDIVTIVYGKPEFLEKLYKSMLDHDPGVLYTWIIVDNHSPEPEKLKPIYDEINKLPNVHIIHSNKNLGFAGGNNLGLERGSSAPYILLLNSDIIIKEDNWLKAMSDELDEHMSVGVVGAKLLFFEKNRDTLGDPARPDGKVQHAGVAFNIIGQPYHIFLGWSRNNPRVDTRREMNCVTGACLLTRKKLYRDIGGLDIVYGPGNFEDVEYCLRCRKMGYQVVYQPKACMYHFAGGSGNSMTAKMNEQIFRIRCSDLTEYDEYRYY